MSHFNIPIQYRIDIYLIVIVLYYHKAIELFGFETGSVQL
jgi:hypothetical protein